MGLAAVTVVAGPLAFFAAGDPSGGGQPCEQRVDGAQREPGSGGDLLATEFLALGI